MNAEDQCSYSSGGKATTSSIGFLATVRDSKRRAQTIGSVVGLLTAIPVFCALASACAAQPATATPTDYANSPTGTSLTSQAATTAETPASDGSIASTAGELADTVAARTPVPLPAPGVIDEGIDAVIANTGLADRSLLGLQTADWVELALSILTIMIGYVIISRLITVLTRWLVRRTGGRVDDASVVQVGVQLKWLLLLFVSRIAIHRLDFLTDGARTALDDVFFGLALLLTTRIAFEVINLIVRSYKNNLDSQEDQVRLTPVLAAVRRLSYMLVLVFAVSIGLSHFGVDVNTISATMVVVGLIIVLGAKGVIADAISGFIILVDQPFRVGDAILIEELNKRGEVTDIGTRTTRIRTGDNREVIIPNAKIGESQIVNYNYPDPSYRVHSDVGVAYGSDMDQVRQVIVDAVRGVMGVLADKPVDVLFLEFDDSMRKIRVRWWIETYQQETPMLNKTNTAIEVALAEAAIAMPNPALDLRVAIQDESASNRSAEAAAIKPAAPS